MHPLLHLIRPTALLSGCHPRRFITEMCPETWSGGDRATQLTSKEALMRPSWSCSQTLLPLPQSPETIWSSPVIVPMARVPEREVAGDTTPVIFSTSFDFLIFCLSWGEPPAD